MRLFYALNFDESTLDRLSSIQKRTNPFLTKGKATSTFNLHLTLSFLGEQSPTLVPCLESILQQLPDTQQRLLFTHIGYFPKRGGSIIWVGVRENPELHSLHRMLRFQLHQQQVPFKDERFKAHITLFRGARFESLPLIEPFRCNAKSISLMHSTQTNGVLTYIPLATKYL